MKILWTNLHREFVCCLRISFIFRLNRSSWKTKLASTSESKKYSIFLITILLINTVIILVVAKNKMHSNNNENNLFVQNQSDVNDYIPIHYQQDISMDSLPDIEEESVDEYNQINNDQQQYTSLIQEDDDYKL